jgi:hypothetical protein
MAELTPSQRVRLGPIVEPFGRSTKEPDLKKLKVGEAEKEEFDQFIHDGKDDGIPPQHVQLTISEVEDHIKTRGRYRDKCFLWVIDESSIKIIRERTNNRKRTHDSECVCHTNLTGGGKAFIGGEMFFSADGKIYVNYFSDRYGNPTAEQWEAAKEYIQSVGYDNLVDIVELLVSRQ